MARSSRFLLWGRGEWKQNQCELALQRRLQYGCRCWTVYVVQKSRWLQKYRAQLLWEEFQWQMRIDGDFIWKGKRRDRKTFIQLPPVRATIYPRHFPWRSERGDLHFLYVIWSPILGPISIPGRAERVKHGILFSMPPSSQHYHPPREKINRRTPTWKQDDTRENIKKTSKFWGEKIRAFPFARSLSRDTVRLHHSLSHSHLPNYSWLCHDSPSLLPMHTHFPPNGHQSEIPCTTPSVQVSCAFCPCLLLGCDIFFHCKLAHLSRQDFAPPTGSAAIKLSFSLSFSLSCCP